MSNLKDIQSVYESVVPKYKIGDKVMVAYGKDSEWNIARLTAGTIKHVVIECIVREDSEEDKKAEGYKPVIIGHKVEYEVFLFDGGRYSVSESDAVLLPTNSFFESHVAE